MLNALTEISPTFYALFVTLFILLNIKLYREIRTFAELTKC